MEILTIYALGSVGSGKHLFFDTLNIHFREQYGMYKYYTKDYNYKGKMYRYIIYFISGNFKDPGLLPSQRTMVDAVLFLLNPLIEDEFHNIENIISRVSEVHPNTLIVLIMQNVFGNIDTLAPAKQKIAINNGEAFCELENKYNLKLISLNYNRAEIESLESGDPMMQFKFFKLFNDAFYEIIHECIERHENPERKISIKIQEL
ncbi:MAG: hypothetical protein ACTSQJ_05720 [Promethearchaeota archaeon]